MSKSEVNGREFWIECNDAVCGDGYRGDCYIYKTSSEAIHVIEYSAYEELKSEIAKLKEYKWMYEDLCK